jgi:hypothetical protein
MRQILNDVKGIILPAISKGTNVSMAMDVNEALDTNNQLFHKWIAECRLVSVHSNLYDEAISTTSKKIDHVFCTLRLLGCITGAVIEPLHNGIFSDHQALIVDSIPANYSTKQSRLQNQNKITGVDTQKSNTTILQQT